MRPVADAVTDQPNSPSPDAGAGDTTAAAHPWAVALGVLVAIVLVIVDQATKQIAELVLDPGRFVPLFGEQIGWQLIYNPGGAFGLPLPSIVPIVVTVVVLVVVVRALPRTTSLLAASAYGMLTAGAVGNVIDRLVRAGAAEGRGFGGGYVVDFVAWGTFPRFNVADSAITVGFILLVLALLIEERRATAADGPRS